MYPKKGRNKTCNNYTQQNKLHQIHLKKDLGELAKKKKEKDLLGVGYTHMSGSPTWRRSKDVE